MLKFIFQWGNFQKLSWIIFKVFCYIFFGKKWRWETSSEFENMRIVEEFDIWNLNSKNLHAENLYLTQGMHKLA